MRALSDDQKHTVDDAIDGLITKRTLERDGDTVRLRRVGISVPVDVEVEVEAHTDEVESKEMESKEVESEGDEK